MQLTSLGQLIAIVVDHLRPESLHMSGNDAAYTSHSEYTNAIEHCQYIQVNYNALNSSRGISRIGTQCKTLLPLALANVSIV